MPLPIGLGPLGLLAVELPFEPSGWSSIGAFAAAAEDAGADGFWLTDHLLWHRPSVEVMTALALAAAATRRCVLGPCVVQLPLRRPAALAKAASFLEALAPGRTVVGVGGGERRDEFELAGLGDVFSARGEALDAGIDELRRVWSLAGRFAMQPPAAPPVWVGGRSPAARRRAAVRGDGWVPYLCRVGWFREQLALLDDDIAASGRVPTDVTRAAVVIVACGADHGGVPDPIGWFAEFLDAPPDALRPHVVTGSPDRIAEEVAGFRSAGADHVALLPLGGDPLEQFSAIRDALGA